MSNCLPGTRWWWNFWLYSTYFTPKNTKPSAMVNKRKMEISVFLPTCEDHTAMAMVKLLASSTTVLNHPASAERIAANGKRREIEMAVRRIGQHDAAEEHDFGDQEDPHPERGSFLLLLEGLELSVQFAGAMHSALLCPSVSGASATPGARPKPSGRSVVSVGRYNPVRCSNIETQIRPVMKVVRLPRDHRGNLKILGGRRRRSFPFEAGRRPRIITRDLAEERSPGQIDHRHQIADGENRGARGGHHVVHLKFRRVDVIAARHAQIAEQELREERQVEANKEYQRRNPRDPLRIHAAGHLRPPKVQAAEVTHDCAADHDVVKVGHDEISVVNVDVRAEAAEEESGEPADEEQAEEAERVEHRRVERNRATVESGRPVKNFYR